MKDDLQTKVLPPRFDSCLEQPKQKFPASFCDGPNTRGSSEKIASSASIELKKVEFDDCLGNSEFINDLANNYGIMGFLVYGILICFLIANCALIRLALEPLYQLLKIRNHKFGHRLY